MKHDFLLSAFGSAVAITAAPFAYAETYLTEQQAGEILFPGETLTEAGFSLTEAERKAIGKASDVRIRDTSIRAFRTSGGGWLFFDDAVGKHEHIDFALALNRDGSVSGVEILVYRESYGHQVRDPRWLAQFKDLTAANPVMVDKDIRNISGATLSCVNISKSVRRLLHTWKIVLAGKS